MGKKLSSNILSVQLSNILSNFISFLLAILYKTSVQSEQSCLHFDSSERKGAELEVKGYQDIALCCEVLTNTMAVLWCNMSVESLI